MKVLVTGHRGYIGVEMVPVLRDAGHEVVGLDTGLYDECDFIAPPDEIPSLDVDLRDVTPAHLSGFDAVMHLGALSNDPLGDVNKQITYDINQHASVRLARAAKAAGVERFLFSSSCSLYGAGGDAFLDENAAFYPVTAYGESKVLVEQEVSRIADESFSPVYLRNATAYGVSRRLRADIVVNNLVGYAFTTGKVLLQSDGTPWRPIVHIRDISAAILSVLEAPQQVIHNEIFNVGQTEENYRIRDLADIVAETVPGCRVEYAPDGGPDKRCYRVNFDKIRRVLPGFHPQWTAHKGAHELYEAYRAVGLSFADLELGRYTRITHIQELMQTGQLNSSLRWSNQHAETAV